MSSLESDPRMLLSFWDGGRCHLTRAMTIAEEAQGQGIEIGFIASEKYAEEVGRLASNSNVYVVPNRPLYAPPPPYEFPLYSHAFRHAQRLRGLGFDDTEWLQSITEQEIAAIRDFKPTVIVNDYRDTVRTSAQVCGIPLVAITHTTGNVDGYTMGWWTAPGDANLPDCRESFSIVRERYGLEPISDEREMFSGDLNVIPSTPAIDPLRRPSPSSHYVGMISKGPKPDPNFRTIDASVASSRVYSYVGEPTRPQYGYEAMLREVIEKDQQNGYYVVGNRERYESAELLRRERAGTFIIDSFLPGRTVIEDSNVVMCHGGNGTVMLSLAMGKPLVCIGPYQSDCTSIFRQVENEGAGIMLNHSKGPLERRPAPDLGEDVSIFGYWSTDLSAETLRETINEVTSNPAYRQNAMRLGRDLLVLGGARRVVELCRESFMQAAHG